MVKMIRTNMFADTFEYDLFNAMKHGNIFERIYHSNRVRTIKNLLNYEGKKVLDLGCQSGIILIPLLKMGVDAYGADISKKDVKNAKHNLISGDLPADRILVSDGKNAPFSAGTFDIVLLIDVLEHVSNPEKVSAEAIRVTKKGGFVISTVPYELHPVVRYSSVRKFFSGRQNIDEVPDIPFSKEKVARIFKGNKVVKQELVFFFTAILTLVQKK